MSRYSKILYGKEARSALKKGMDEVVKTVAGTLGASGRNVAYMEFGSPVFSNDGVSVARKVKPKDDFEFMGAQLIKQTSEQTNKEAGDGTSSTLVIAYSIIEEGLKEIDSGKNPMVIRKELESAKDKVIEHLKELSVPVKTENDILDVAKVSVEDDKIAQTIADAVKKSGPRGAVIVEESSGFSIEKEEVQGYFWDKGYVSPYMVTNDRGEAILTDCPVVVTDRYMNLNKDLVVTIDGLMKQGYRSALIIVDKMEGELLQTAVINKMKGIFTAIVVNRPPTIEELEDVACITGANSITKDKGIKDIPAHFAGFATKVVVKKDSTTIVGKDSDSLQTRILELEKQLGEDKNNESLKSRLGKLASGIVMIKVGAKTESERKYLKLKIDDAVCACKAAMEEGIVEGAGVTLLKLAEKTDNPILKEAFKKPFATILENANIPNSGQAYNVLTGKKIKDCFKEGIIDPTKVVRCEIENSLSFASTFLTLGSVLVELEKESPELDLG